MIGFPANLACQMVCYIDPSEKASLATVLKKGGLFHTASDWMKFVIKLFPKCGEAKTVFPSRKKFTVVLFFSFNEYNTHQFYSNLPVPTSAILNKDTALHVISHTPKPRP